MNTHDILKAKYAKKPTPTQTQAQRLIEARQALLASLDKEVDTVDIVKATVVASPGIASPFTGKKYTPEEIIALAKIANAHAAKTNSGILNFVSNADVTLEDGTLVLKGSWLRLEREDE